MIEDDRPELLRLYEHVKAAMNSDDPRRWELAAEEVQPLFAAPAFATRLGQAAVPVPQSGRALRDWWKRGGSTWVVRRFSANGKTLDFPPTMRPLPGGEDVPKVVTCEAPACGRSTEFLREVEEHELLLQGYERARTHSIVLSKTDVEGGRSNLVQRACRADDLDGWTACVAGARSARFVFPIGDFRMPKEGWLFFSRGGGEQAVCRETTAVNLGSGIASWSSGCENFSGRADLGSFRELALLSVLAGHSIVVSDGQTVAIPSHLRTAGGCSQVSEPPGSAVRISRHETLEYWLWGSGGLAASGRLRPGDYGYPVADVVDVVLARSRGRLTVTRDAVVLPRVTDAQDEALSLLVEELVD